MRTAILAWLMLATVAWCGDITLPAELKLEPGRLGKLAADSKGEVIRWVNPSPGMDLIPSESGRWVIVSALKPGAYPIYAYTAVGGKPTEAVRCLVVVGTPKPDPEPGPQPEPGPKPDPLPPLAKAWFVVVEETQEARADRGKFLADPGLAAYFRAKGWKARIVDKDVKDASGKVPADVAPFIERARGKSLPVMYLVDQDGAVRLEGGIPDSPERLLAILKEIGG